MNNKTKIIGIIIAIVLSVFVTNGCKQKDKTKIVKADTIALQHYQDGKYRHSVDRLLKKEKLNSLEYYLLGRNHQELRDYHKAVKSFSKVKLNDFTMTNQLSFIKPNYSYYYANALIKSPVAYSNSLEVVTSLIGNLTTNSFYYNEVFNIYVCYLWKNQRYTTITNIIAQNTTVTKTGKWYKKLALNMLGKKNNQSAILAYYRRAPHKTAFLHIITNLDTTQFNTKAELNNALDIALSFKKFELATKLLDKYNKKYKDKDYYERNMAIIEYKQRKRDTAIKRLQKFTKTNKASRKTYRRLLKYLYSRRHYSEALTVVRKLRKKYPGSYANDYYKVLSRLNRATELKSWYLKNQDNYSFKRRYSTKIMRHLLRKKDSYAQTLMKQKLNKGANYSVLLMSAMLNYEKGKTQTAYRQLLKITVDRPFTYEWLVAKHYEAKLRKRYKKIYNNKINNRIASLQKRSLKDRYYYYLGIKEIDPKLFEKKLAKDFTKTKTAYEKILQQYFTVSEEIPEIVNLTNTPGILYWNKEVHNYIEDAIDRRCTNKSRARNFRTKTRYTWHYREIYKKMKLQGTLVARLNSYFFSVVGSRHYHTLLPENILKEAYPLLEFDTINSVMKSTNNSLWVMSSFREESHFRKHVTSWVGAVGYAQVMPYTARLIKKRIKRPKLRNRDFEDNVYLGITLFSWLFKKYKNNYPYALGAYNGGEGAVNRWRKRYKYKTELWIDCTEFDETRNYIKRIMVTRMYYDRLYGMGDFEYAKFSEK